MNEHEINISVIALFPKEVDEKIQNLRLEISRLFGAQDALNWPPHTTIRPGFLVPKTELDTFLKDLKKHTKKVSPFTIKLSGFKFFDNAPLSNTIKSVYVVTIDVEKNEEITKTNEELKKFEPFSLPQTREFSPHVTLAYNDVTKKQFEEIKEFLKNRIFQESCVINTIGLFENKGLGTRREMLASLKLGE